MRKPGVLYLLILIGLAACEAPKNELQSLTGDWQFSQENDSIWYPSKVPGTVQTDLLALDKIPDPFLLNNEDSIQWVSEKNWRYKRQFSVSEATLQKTKHFLKFDGLDTYAEVYLNDILILSANNAFRSWEVDISDAILSENRLEILFKSPDSIEKAEASKLEYELPETPRVFTRKPQFQYGWDWGPTIKTMGIWRDISLVSYETVRLKEAFLQTTSLTDTLAEITAHLSLEALEYEEISVEITNNNTGEVFKSSFEVSAAQTEYTVPLSITNPKLWWTHNLGTPYLYDFTIQLKKGQTFIESISKKIGLRTIELITEKDTLGESFYFKLNGKPVYMKGANYIPQDIFLPNVTLEARTKLLDDVARSNMNTLRVWGGGVYEDNAFYDLCDEKGILVWQDFMFACAMYPGDAAFLENVKQEAIDNVKRLRQHPSIALWCGNNENSEGWHRWGWKDGKTEAQHQEIWNGYYAVFNHILPRVVDSLHPSVSYWESSPKYGRGDERYQFEGDAHDWWVWHDGYPFEHFEAQIPRFMSEFGFQSFPSHEAIRYFTEQDSIDLNHPAFASHQKHARGFQLIREYMERDFPVPENDSDYVYVSQLLQAFGIEKAIHAHRRAKPYNMGTLFWQLNDCWPVVSWSSIDGLGNWKALQYKAKMAFENVLISAEQKNDSVAIYVVNDTFESLAETTTFTLLDFYGNVLYENEFEAECLPNSSAIIYTLALKELSIDPTFTVLKIAFGKHVYLHYFVKPKDLKLPRQEFHSKIERNDSGFLITFKVAALRKNVFLSVTEKGFWSDNYFDMLPGESKTVQFYTESDTITNLNIKSLADFYTNYEAIPPIDYNPCNI
ncbi:beta-mannosidase [Ulvibacter sp. MAR_2010_11]|uniref:beta-mannosidase n=1 Tax=Ulvibacter sp. MAR_2010_11 TaxID=1250229 RepID=UPI000C2B716B|nr:glycoside hydrolase family 2 protein [Ulvibacter sp. MAR_2010_11]PKA83022.1 beta-mannosidase [Ulvibacter sp. MAR_2010_11]